MDVELNITSSTRGTSGESGIPFVGHMIPFIGHTKPLELPSVCHKLPFVTKQRKQRGFTLVELMITLVILGVLSAIAAPAIQGMVLNNRIVTETNDMLVSLMFARSEAIKRSTPVVLCKTLNPEAVTPVCDNSAAWKNGWLIFSDETGDSVYNSGTETLLRIGDGFPGTDNKIKLDTGASSLGFTRLGLLATGGAIISICDSRGSGSARVLDLHKTGRSRVNRDLAADCT